MVVNLIEWSNKLLEAETTCQGIEPISKVVKSFTLKDAYYIQLETIHAKLASGQKITGKKIGLTSLAMQQLLKVGEPDYGHLLDSMEVLDGKVKRDSFLLPRVEGEIAFVLKESLKGPHITTEDVIKATDYVMASIEIVDSRVKDWKIKLEDTVADNASSGKYVLGLVQRKIHEVDLPNIEMKLFKNGHLVNEGKGEAALGNPASCVAWLANRLADFHIELNAGEVILSGALSAAVDAEQGDVFTADFGDVLGKVEVSFI